MQYTRDMYVPHGSQIRGGLMAPPTDLPEASLRDDESNEYDIMQGDREMSLQRCFRPKYLEIQY